MTLKAIKINAEGCRGLPPKNLKKRKLIKSVVGKVRTSSYQLPGEEFVYGILNQMDIEGAGRVMQSWSQLEPSQPKASLQSFPATNRVALKNGCLDAKSQREFGKSNPVLKKNAKRGKNGVMFTEEMIHDNSATGTQVTETRNDVASHANNILVFGMKNHNTDMPMTQLIKSSSPICAWDDVDYPDVSNMKKKGRLPPAKQTKASQLLKDSMIHAKKDESMVSEWKMKRFVNGIESKVALRLKQSS